MPRTQQGTKTKRGVLIKIRLLFFVLRFRQNKAPPGHPSGHPSVQRMRFAGTQLLDACGPIRRTRRVPMTLQFNQNKDLLLESLLFLMPLMLLAQLLRMGRTVIRQKPAIWTTVCLTWISQRQGCPGLCTDLGDLPSELVGYIARFLCRFCLK
jgi:TRAP-type uncharacterized transport system fused permease subunit